jgi:hypothetical protein
MKHEPVAAADRSRKENMGKITGFMEYERVEEGYRPCPSA